MARKSKIKVWSKRLWALLGGALCFGFWGCEKGSDPQPVLQACFDMCAVQATAVDCPDSVPETWESVCKLFFEGWVADLPEGCEHWAKISCACLTQQEYHCVDDDPDVPANQPVLIESEACVLESADLQLCLPDDGPDGPAPD